MKYNGISWSYIGNPGAIVGCSGTWGDIAVDSVGTPYVVYPGSLQKCTVKKYNGTNWVTLGSSSTTSATEDQMKIAIDDNGTPYIVYRESQGILYVKKYNGIGWINLNVAVSLGNSPNIAIDPNGQPYFVYGGGRKCKVLKYNGSGWTKLYTQGFTQGETEFVDIAVDGNGTPYVAYSDIANGQKCSVMTYNGTSWVIVNYPGLSVGATAFEHIAIGNNNIPYMVYMETAVYGYRASVKRYYNGDWYDVGPLGFSTGQARYTNIAIDNNGTPYVVFEDGYLGKVTVMKFNGTAWVNVGLAKFSLGQVNYLDIAIDTAGTPYVVYQDIASANKITVKKFNGTVWVNVGASGFSAGQADNTSIAIDGSGTPYVVYQDYSNGQKCTVKKFNGTSWINVGSAGFSAGRANLTNISINKNGTPYVVFSDGANENKGTIMKYNGSTWVNIDSAGFTGGEAKYPSLAISNTGKIYMAFANEGAWAYTYDESDATINNSPVCIGSTLLFNALGGTNGYSWVGPNGFISSIASPTISNCQIANTGTYSVTISNSVCTSTQMINLVVNQLPLLSVNNGTTCSGSSYTLTPGGANTYTYSGGNHVVSPLIDQTYTITGIDINNCSNTTTVSVTVDNTCQDVWPGDANSDGLADNLDILELGLHYTQTGSPRTATSNSWQSYFANNWVGTITNGKNLNHSDCHGDGTINDDDTLAIYTNYGLTHAFKTAQTTTVNPQLSIIPDQVSVDKGKWGTASIYLGDASSSINTINGIAYTITYDNAIIETDSVYIDYTNSFLNTGNQNLNFRKRVFSSGVIYTASTHTLNNNVNGFGKIATLHYKINPSLSTDEVLNVGLVQANQSDASGLITPLTSGTGTLIAKGTFVGLQEIFKGSNVSISPNPTNGILNITFGTIPQNTKIAVYNSIGALVLTETLNNKNNTINTSQLSNGMYLIKVLENNRITTVQKIVKQ